MQENNIPIADKNPSSPTHKIIYPISFLVSSNYSIDYIDRSRYEEIPLSIQ
jgi:hypothetical protein